MASSDPIRDPIQDPGKTPIRNAIRNPIEWSLDQLNAANLAVRRAGGSLRRPEETRSSPIPEVRPIEVTDLRDVLARGLSDFAAYRTDVIFLCIIYPLVGLILARVAFGYDMLPLLFPLASGFALIGPVAAVRTNRRFLRIVRRQARREGRARSLRAESLVCVRHCGKPNLQAHPAKGEIPARSGVFCGRALLQRPSAAT
jgi:hypothetical protein